MRKISIHAVFQGVSVAAVSGSILCGLLALFVTLGTSMAQDPQGPPQGEPPAGVAQPNGPGMRRGQRGFMMRGGAFGTVSSVGVDRFEIKRNDGSTQTVIVDDKTEYRESEKAIGLEDLKPGDHVMVRARDAASANGAVQGMPPADAHASAAQPSQGSQPGTTGGSVVTAAVVRRLTDQQMEWSQGERAFGQIKAINGNEIILENPRQGELTVEVTDSTAFMKQGSAITLKDLKVGDRIMARGKTTNGKFVADRVMTGMGGGLRRGQMQPGTGPTQ